MDLTPSTSKGLQCFVPTCNNNQQATPEKLFVRVHYKLKKQWCIEVNAKYKPTIALFICEDHVDLAEDLENYHKWKLMNDTPKMKADAKLRYQTPMDKENIDNKIHPIAEMVERAPILTKLLLTARSPLKRKHEYSILPSVLPKTKDSFTQCEVKMLDKATNYKIRKEMPFQESCAVPVAVQSETSEEARTSPSLFGSTYATSETECGLSTCKDFTVRQQTLQIINNRPKMYIGVPSQYIWILDYILNKSSIKTTRICLIITLLKIKLNDSFERIGDQFQMSKQYISNMLPVAIEVLANFLQNFIFMPNKMQIKQNLPITFKIRFSNVQMIIDCFEIQVEKPTDPVKQAQTWSQYKSCNTVKYLVGATPNGFISFISKGYGGRISDKALVEKSNLLDVLPTNAVVMADRGFKEVEALFASKNIKLLRPPSVYSGIKPTKEQVLQTKIIASLRIHIERVIRRIREFKLLKPHSVVNSNLVYYLDEILIIACGLINLQGEIIKNN